MTSGARPDLEDRPDLVAQASSHQAASLADRGTLCTYLGIAPGVGKTYAMLRDGRARRRAATDTVVAYWQRHGRPATAAQLGDLELIPARTVTYRGASFAELDVQAVLDRRPELALVDELAHANLPGERHAKRWQDVEDLLASGIDVHTTLNVANIESLGPTVAQITGVHQAEPVPDVFVRTRRNKLVDLAGPVLGEQDPGQHQVPGLAGIVRLVVRAEAVVLGETGRGRQVAWASNSRARWAGTGLSISRRTW